MFERLINRGRAICAERRSAAVERLSKSVPAGVDVEANEDGVVLSGRGLKRRLIADPALRTLWR